MQPDVATITHTELAIRLLRDAAGFFRNVGEQNPALRDGFAPMRRGQPPSMRRLAFGILVEAGGIEPPSAWLPSSASTCVAPCLI